VTIKHSFPTTSYPTTFLLPSRIFPTGFFSCCSLVGHSTLGVLFLGTSGVFGCGASGALGGLIGGGSGASVVYSNLFGSYSTGLKEGVPASHKVMTPSGSSSFSPTFLSFSLCASTHPGMFTIGVPISDVTGGYIGSACGGSDVIHLGNSGIPISRILILFNRISGMGITQPGFRVLS